MSTCPSSLHPVNEQPDNTGEAGAPGLLTKLVTNFDPTLHPGTWVRTEVEVGDGRQVRQSFLQRPLPSPERRTTVPPGNCGRQTGVLLALCRVRSQNVAKSGVGKRSRCRASGRSWAVGRNS